MVIIAAIYILRLFYIQVVDAKYTQLANNNVLRRMMVYPARGLIYDRNGKLILYNEPEYDLMVVPGQVKHMDTAAFCKQLGIDSTYFVQTFKNAYTYSRFKPSVFLKGLSAEMYGALEENLFMYPGFYAEVRTVRGYPYPCAAHVLGYISEVTPKQVEDSKNYYHEGDYIGTSGLEESYEDELRGKRGVRYVLVDVHNREQGSFNNGLYDTVAVAGKKIESTINIDLQEYGEKLMTGKVGSIVAIEPSSGEVLALVSNPTYDPNLLTGKDRGKNYMMLLNDKNKPLFNRALMAPYPPGSTFKPLQALIGLNEKVTNPNEGYSCSGAFVVGNLRVGCDVHPYLNNIKDAIKYSCNSYFCNNFRKILDNPKYSTRAEALAAWDNYVHQFNIGKRTGIDLPNEVSGNTPTPDYYNKIYGTGSWNALTIIFLGIGQGEMEITPIQLCNYVSCVANKGYYYTPHLVRKIDGDSSVTQRFHIKHVPTIDTSLYAIVIDGMEDVVQGGTGALANIPDITVCGKTGTAQNPHGKSHSLFICFAPKDHPKIAVSVVVENAGWGARFGAPIASLIIEKYLKGQITEDNRKQLEQTMIDTHVIDDDTVAHAKYH